MLTQKQHTARLSGIGASECAAIMGFDPYRTAHQIWLEKTGRLERENLDKNSFVYWGSVLEDDVADAYAEATGHKLRKIAKTLRHAQYDWMLCHLDRKVIGHRKILECKTADKFAKGWGAAGSDHVPEQYIIQVQHQMAVTGYQEADIAVLIGGNDFRIYPIKKDPQLIDVVTQSVNNFWKNHVLADIPPQPTSYVEAIQRWPKDDGKGIEATDDIIKTIIDYKKSKQSAEDLKDKLAVYFADASFITYQGKILGTFKTNKNGARTLRIN